MQKRGKANRASAMQRKPSVGKIRAKRRRLPRIEITLEPGKLRADRFQPRLTQHKIRGRRGCLDSGDDRQRGTRRVSRLLAAAAGDLRAAPAGD